MDNRKILASKLETNQDSVAEYLFDDVQRKISADAVLKSILQAGTTDAAAGNTQGQPALTSAATGKLRNDDNGITTGR
jgi:hypothetical protein